MKKSLSRGAQLTVAVIVLMFAGIIYAWSNISSPLAELFPDASALTFTYTLTIWFFCIGGLVSGLISAKVGVRERMILSAALLLAGFFVTSCLREASSIALLYLAYGVLAGGGIGIVYNTVIASVTSLFPDKKGFCSGMLMMGFGIGSFLIGLAAANILKADALGWRTLYRILGALSALTLLLGALLLSPAKGKKPAAVSEDADDLSPREMLRRPSFWKLFVFFVLFSAVGSSALALSRSFCASVSIPAAAAAVIAATVSVANSAGRLASGALFDKLGLTKTKFATSGIAIGAPLLALLGILLHSTVLAVIGLLLCGFSYGFSPTVSAAFTMEFYGKKHYGANLSIINLVLIPGAFVPTLATMLLNRSGGSYWIVFGLLCVFSLIGLAINCTIKSR